MRASVDRWPRALAIEARGGTVITKGIIVRACMSSLIIAVFVVACTTNHTESTGSDQQGIAELHVDAHSLIGANVTRVTVDNSGQTTDLAFNPRTGTFDAELLLTAGTQTLTAHAFAGDTLVGASNPTPVVVTDGIITRVVLRILDLTTGPPQVFGPIFDSISFPTTTEVNTLVTFAIAVIAPVGDPVTYAWSADCADGSFTPPDAATTQFSKPTAGACAVTVTATSNGFSVVQSFVIAVFPAGATSGALLISTAFVSPPTLQISLPDLGCSQSSNSIGFNASCQNTIAAPTVTSYNASVLSWNGSDPGTIDVTDNCGGSVGVSSGGSSDLSGFWLPPAAGGTCIITARAVDADGLVTTESLAVLARPGTAPPIGSAPSVFAEYETGCVFGGSTFPSFCGSFSVGAIRTVFYEVFLFDGHPGRTTMTDTCAGPQRLPITPNGSFNNISWTEPAPGGRNCTTTMHATTLEGAVTDVVANRQLF